MPAAPDEQPGPELEDGSADRPSDISELLRAEEPAPVAEVLVERVAARLKAIGNGETLNQVLQIGETIFRELYQGRRTRPRQGQSTASLRQLAAHPDVGVKLTTLWRALSVYEMSLRFPQLFERTELGVSHFRAVAGLALEEQRALLQRAAEERWTKRRLELEVARRPRDRRRGRRPLPKPLKWARELERLLETAPERCDALDPYAAEELCRVLTRVASRCAELERQLGAGGPGKGPPAG